MMYTKYWIQRSVDVERCCIRDTLESGDVAIETPGGVSAASGDVAIETRGSVECSFSGTALLNPAYTVREAPRMKHNTGLTKPCLRDCRGSRQCRM